MSQAKFSVGQKVLLTSRVAPQMNGVYKVSKVYSLKDFELERGPSCNGYVYQLHNAPGDWAEHCLQAIN
jgi:hypothetical protein